MSIYKKVKSVKPDKQIIIYGKSCLESGSKIPLGWKTWLGMFKEYQKASKDEMYLDLREILVSLFQEETVTYLESVVIEDTSIWGLGHGKD